MDPLVRGITRGHLLALTINCVIGAGILGLPSTVYARVGDRALIVWVGCAAVVALIALSLAEVGSRFRTSGGAYLYAHAAFGPTVGFLTGWLSLLTRTLAFASVCNLFLAYTTVLAPGVDQGLSRVVLVTAVVVALSAVLILGIRQTAWTSTLLTVLKVLLLGSFVIAGLVVAPATAPLPIALPTAPATPPDWLGALLPMMFAFAGFEAAAIPAGESRDPQRDLPIAVLGGMTVVAAIYVSVQWVCITHLPELALSSRPVADVAHVVLGPAGGRVVTVGALLLLLGTMLTQALGTSRMLYAMAEQDQLPRWLTAVHAVWRTPVLAILLTGAGLWLAAVASSFLTAVAVTVVTRVLTYAVIALALPVLRRRSGVPPAAFRVPFGDAVAVAAAGSSLVLLWAATTRELLIALALVVVGLVVRAVSRVR